MDTSISRSIQYMLVFQIFYENIITIKCWLNKFEYYASVFRHGKIICSSKSMN